MATLRGPEVRQGSSASAAFPPPPWSEPFSLAWIARANGITAVNSLSQRLLRCRLWEEKQGNSGPGGLPPSPAPMCYLIHSSTPSPCPIIFKLQNSVLSEICPYFSPQPGQPRPASRGLLPPWRWEKERSPVWSSGSWGLDFQSVPWGG